jgi:hypothetical protein
MPLYKQLQR